MRERTHVISVSSRRFWAAIGVFAIGLATWSVGGGSATAAFAPEPFEQIEPGEWTSRGFLARAAAVDPSSGLVWMVLEDLVTDAYYGISLDAETRTWGTAVEIADRSTALAIAADGQTAFLARDDNIVERRSLPDLALIDSIELDGRGIERVRIRRLVASGTNPDLVVATANSVHGVIGIENGAELPDRVVGNFDSLVALDDGLLFGVSLSTDGRAIGTRLAVTATGLDAEETMTIGPIDSVRCEALGVMPVCTNTQNDQIGVVDPAAMAIVAAWNGPTIVDPFRDRIYSRIGTGHAVRTIDGTVERVVDTTEARFGGLIAAGGVSVGVGSGSVRLVDIDGLPSTPQGDVASDFTEVRPGFRRLAHPFESALQTTPRNLVVSTDHTRAYVAVASESTDDGARIVRFDPRSATVTGSVAVPLGPTRLALSSDDTVLWATTMAGDVLRFDAMSLTQTGRFTPWQPLREVDDVVAVPGARDQVVVRNRIGAQLWIDGVVSGDHVGATEILPGIEDGQVVAAAGSTLRILAADGSGLTELRSTFFDGELKTTANGSIWTTEATIDPDSLEATPLPVPNASPIPGSTDVVEFYAGGATVYSTNEFAWLGTADVSWSDGSSPFRPFVHLGGKRFGVAHPSGIGLFDLPPDVPSGGEYVGLTPSRVLDTRTGLGQSGRVAPIGWGATRDLQLAGRGGVPETGAIAVVANVTVTQPTLQGFLTVWPKGEERPPTSTINFPVGRTVANLATIVLGDDGMASIFNRFGESHVVVDVVGYYTGATDVHGARYRGAEPRRVLDTRDWFEYGDTRSRPPGPLGQDDSITFDIASWYDGERQYARAAILNVTAVNPTQSTFVTVYPGDLKDRPLAANLNTADGRTVPNQVIVTIPPSGEITLYNRWGSVDLVVDLMGYYGSDYYEDGGRLVLISPERLLDTREDSPYPGDGSLFPDSTLFFAGEPDTAYSGFAMNVSVTQPTEQGYLAVHPWPGRATTASLNFTPGLTVANHVTVAAGPGIGFYNRFGQTHVVADLFGLFLREEPIFEPASSQAWIRSGATTGAPSDNSRRELLSFSEFAQGDG